MKRYKRYILLSMALILLVIGVAIAVSSSKTPPKLHTFTAFDFMDTVSTVSLYNLDVDAANNIAQQVFDKCRELSALVDMRDPASEVALLSAAGGNMVDISSDTEAMLKVGIEAARQSDGLFDITIGSVSILWDYSNRIVPGDADIADALSRVSIDNLLIQNGAASIKNGAMVDLGALAKGYALDAINILLEELSIDNALVNLGGSVLARGVRPDKQPWRVGIQNPFDANNAQLGVVELSGMCVVTAGVYQRSFMDNDIIFHHILDPRTGKPADTNVYGATIITTNGAWADAYSTICVLMGEQRALDYIGEIDGVECILALNDGSVVTSNGIGVASKIKFTKYGSE